MRPAFLFAVCSSAIVLAGAASADAAFTWTGPYAGLNVGGVFDAQTRVDQTTGFLPNNSNALAQGLRPENYNMGYDKGFTGGAQIGYNFQIGDLNGLVLGAEADIAYTDIDKTDVLSNTTLIGPLGVPSTTPVLRVNEYHTELDYLGTLRGRVGYASGQFLVYGTGGLAYGRVNQRITFYGPDAPTTPFFSGENNGTRTGYTYGGGIEYALPTNALFDTLNVFNSSAITIKAEYLYYHLDNDTLTYPGVNGGATIGGYTSRLHTDGELARLGINYKF